MLVCVKAYHESFFSRKEACLPKHWPARRRQAKESPSDAGLPKFKRKNRAKTKPRPHTGPPWLRGFLSHKPTRIFPFEFLTANPLRLALSYIGIAEFYFTDTNENAFVYQ